MDITIVINCGSAGENEGVQANLLCEKKHPGEDPDCCYRVVVMFVDCPVLGFRVLPAER